MELRYEKIKLTAFIRAARWRWRGAAILKGLTISLAIGGLASFGSAALADQFHYAASWVAALRILSLVIFVAALGFFLLRPLLKRVPDPRMARLIEEKHPGLHDRLVSAVEFAEKTGTDGAPIIDRLIQDAAEQTRSVDLNRVASQKRLWLSGGALLGLVMTLGWLLTSTFFTGFSKLYAPWSRAAGMNPYAIIVHPGDARVPKGADQVIAARLQGFDAEEVDIYLKRPDQTSWHPQPMELTDEAREYRFLLFNLQQGVSYYAQAGNIRSPGYTIEVAELAWVERISLSYRFPGYTHMPVKTVEDGGDIVALKGTRVKLVVTLTRPADAAKIILDDGVSSLMKPVGPNQFAGEIVVRNKGTYHIDLTAEGETYTGSNVYEILALDDEAPNVAIEKPGRDVKATSVQEVFIQATAEDDNGIAALGLHYSVNGGDEHLVTLYRARRDPPSQINGTYTFFLEEYELQPGDFISYYATAADSNTASGPNRGSSDIYFLEIRPFERAYRQAQQNAGLPGGGGDSALTRRQKEIITATWHVIRDQSSDTPQEVKENLTAIMLIQDRVRDDTRGLAARIRRRLGTALDEQTEFKQLTEFLERAAVEMASALAELKAGKANAALPHEQRALQQLMRADAIFRDIQVAFSTRAQGGGDKTEAEDLADLFELELDRMKNQYETLQRDRGRQQDRQVDETLRKLQQLARRQQQLAERQLQRSFQRESANQSGSAAQQQRQVMEETQTLARRLDRLSRQRRDRRLAEISRQLNRAAEEMERAQRSGDSAEAGVRRLRAAEQLDAAGRQLKSRQQAHRREAIQRLRERAAEMVERQRGITKEVTGISRSAGPGSRQPLDAKKRRLEERKQVLAEHVEDLERDIEAAARAIGQQRQSASEKLRKAADAIRRNRLPDKIRQASRMLENGWYDQARQREKQIEKDLEEVARNLEDAEAPAGAGGDTEKLERALSRTRRLVNDLESLQRRLQDQAQARAQQHGGRPSQRQEESQDQSGRQQEEALSQGPPSGSQESPNQNQQGGRNLPSGGRQNSADENQSTQFWDRQGEELSTQGGRPRIMGDPRQFRRELRERLSDAEALRRQLGSEFAGDIDQLIRRLRQLDNRRIFNDPQEILRLRSELIDPLHELEHALMRRLRVMLGEAGPLLADETSVPQAYRKLVEEYYKRLASEKRELENHR